MSAAGWVGAAAPTATGSAAGLGDLTTSPTALAGAVAEVGEPDPAPTQAPVGGLESWDVSPGLVGFVPVFLIALACVGLFLSLTRHMRRVTVRAALRDAQDEPAPAGGDGDVPPAPGRSGAGRPGEERSGDGRVGGR